MCVCVHTPHQESIDQMINKYTTQTGVLRSRMLPYQTLEEAEVSLGRNLTFAETLWFKYSAQKPDYVLYYHNTFFLFIFYTVLPLPHVIIELMRSKKIDRFKIQPKIRNSLSDMLDCYRKVILTFVLAVGPLQIFSYPIIQVYIYVFMGVKEKYIIICGIEIKPFFSDLFELKSRTFFMLIGELSFLNVNRRAQIEN